MPKAAPSVSNILQRLESHYGKQEPSRPTDPYLFLVWWYCGYPASDTTCGKGWQALHGEVGVEPQQILAASPKGLAEALKPGGMLPELRAMRLKELAARVQDEFGGDLRAALVGPMPQVRKILKTFHSIADPGSDRIILFAGIAPVAAVASNCPHVLVRILHGRDGENYRMTYRQAQEAIESELPAKADARIRAYLLLKRHGQDLCKRTKPRCTECPVSASCAYFVGKQSGRVTRPNRS